MNKIRLNDNLKTAIKASLKAGKAIMQVYDTDYKIEIKNDKSPLTEADKRANKIINELLKDTPFPIISEENKQISYIKRRQWETCWIVDPVDGTKEFIRRNGEFTVNIALVRKGSPQYGVIYVPAIKRLYVGDAENQKAFSSDLNSHDSTLEEVVASAVILKSKTPSGFVEVVGSRSHMNQETLDFVENIKSSGRDVSVVSKGSSLKFCLVAEGRADIYPRFAPTMEWDTAAGHAICNAVGLEVVSEATNEPLLYNKKNLQNPWFVVSNQ